MNPSLLYKEIVELTGIFSLDKATSLEGKLLIQNLPSVKSFSGLRCGVNSHMVLN